MGKIERLKDSFHVFPIFIDRIIWLGNILSFLVN